MPLPVKTGRFVRSGLREPAARHQRLPGRLSALLWGFHNGRSGCCWRADRREGGVRTLDLADAPEGAGVGRRAHLVEPDHTRPSAPA